MRKWENHTIETYEDWQQYKNGILQMHPEYAAFDTETTGLRIKADKPFIFQFGFLDPRNTNKGYTFLIDFRDNKEWYNIITEWHDIARTCKLYMGHNIKFDLHMLENVGIIYRTENMTDTQFYIRYSGDALHASEGGPPLGLKDFAARYIDSTAKYHERLLAKERTELAKYFNLDLKKDLTTLGAPPPQFKQKSYTLSVIEEMFKDPIFDETDLEPNVRNIYEAWKAKLPAWLKDKVTSIVSSDMIQYNMLNKENLHKYAHLDIVYTLEIFEKLKPILEYRHNTCAVELENSLILPFFDMENTGFLADKPYLEEARKKIKAYILQKRAVFRELAGENIKIGQHAEIKNILNTKYNLGIESTNNAELEKISNSLMRNDPENPALEFINVLSELRTLEKWYSVYIIRFQNELKHTDKLYTTIQAVGTVSGRVTSDFQQFPKEGLKNDQGEELFHPRKLVLVPPDKKALLYLDYSQIELRFQAIYTILVGAPDMNMCRAYMPYKCHKPDGTKFDYNNPEHIKAWNEEWYIDEDNTKWTPTDVHAATTIAAGFSRDDPEFSHYRKTIGKRVNFAKNYGASLQKIIWMFPEKSFEECQRIDEAYYKAFPGVKMYHQYCYNRAQNYPYTQNLFGVRYYNISGHKLRNTLVQGSAAHFLKYRIRALWEYMQKHHLKSRMQMQIHDELVFELDPADGPVARKFKAIMEDWPDTLVPIVAEAEVTKTNWAEKKELKL